MLCPTSLHQHIKLQSSNCSDWPSQIQDINSIGPSKCCLDCRPFFIVVWEKTMDSWAKLASQLHVCTLLIQIQFSLVHVLTLFTSMQLLTSTMFVLVDKQSMYRLHYDSLLLQETFGTNPHLVLGSSQLRCTLKHCAALHDANSGTDFHTCRLFSVAQTPPQLHVECIHGIFTLHACWYVARPIPPVFLRMGVRVALLTVTTTCDFERGGATKLIIGSTWNNGVKNRLDLYQVQKHSNLIMLIVFHWLWHL